MKVFSDPPPDAPRLEVEDVHPGFGVVSLCRDGVEVERDVNAPGRRQCGRLHIDGPLSSAVYAFTSDGEWTLIETRRGFA